MKKSPSVSFLLPGLPTRPAGGFKVALEYANYLAGRGYDVHILYPDTLYFNEKSLLGKIRALLHYPYSRLKRFSARNWFKLDPTVREHHLFSLNPRLVPETDYYVATARATAFCAKKYDVPDAHKLYLIQGFEAWGFPEEVVYSTYRLGLKNIVISNWLRKKVEGCGAQCTLIRNGFDFNYFRLTRPVDDRSPYTVSMMYSDDKNKGYEYGEEALCRVRERYPQLKVMMFGTPERPADMPGWIEYYRRPDRETHNLIYNSSSIYLAPSLQEGWGLTVGEAMICGNAIVCTDTLGFQEMVTDGKEGLIVPVKNSRALADAMLRLMDNPELRLRMANAAVHTISSFTWEQSFRKFESLLVP